MEENSKTAVSSLSEVGTHWAQKRERCGYALQQMEEPSCTIPQLQMSIDEDEIRLARLRFLHRREHTLYHQIDDMTAGPSLLVQTLIL